MGAALSKVSGTFDQVVPLKNTTREKVRIEAEQMARKRAMEAGADEQTLQVIGMNVLYVYKNPQQKMT